MNTATLSVEDLNITVAKDATSSSAANGAGLTVAGAGATITYVHSGAKWALNKNTDVTGTFAVSGLTTLTGGIQNTTFDFGTYQN